MSNYYSYVTKRIFSFKKIYSNATAKEILIYILVLIFIKINDFIFKPTLISLYNFLNYSI